MMLIPIANEGSSQELAAIQLLTIIVDISWPTPYIVTLKAAPFY